MKPGLDLELADRLGGSEGGWAFWSAMLAAVEAALANSRERRQAFSSWPSGELRRFVTDLHDALGLAVTAVAVQEAINNEPSNRTPDEWRERVDELLLDRVRDAGAAADK